MKCEYCGKIIEPDDAIVGTNRIDGHKEYYCRDCFAEHHGQTIEQYADKKVRAMFIPFCILALILTAIYHSVSNIYIGMIIYTVISYIVVECIVNTIANDEIKLIAIFIMTFSFTHFSLAYELFLLGMLIQTLGFDQNRIIELSELRRKYGLFFNIAGIVLMILGVIMGAYNIFIK